MGSKGSSGKEEMQFCSWYQVHFACIFLYNANSFISRYSLLPTITTKGIIYSHIKLGGYNGDEFSNG
jgi:hypothetical protein